MVKCTFCGDKLLPGRGKLFARTSGEIKHFCNSKCQKNAALKRQGVKVRWTALHKKRKANTK